MMEMKTAPRREEFPWLGYGAKGTEYLDPAYYDRILKPYIFSRTSDLGLFRAFLERSHIRPEADILEIGPGTGRGTKILYESLPRCRVDFVDQSQRMLDYIRKEVQTDPNGSLIRSDAISLLTRTPNEYDLVFSLWSLSHSIHQNISRHGVQHGFALATFALRRLFSSLLKPSGKFYFIHFDSTSQEQTISLRQRTRVESWIVPGVPPPSQVIIEEVLAESQRAGLIQYRKQHLKGAPIVYSSLDEALEVFMNFHMEGAFNRTPNFNPVIDELAADLSRYQLADGSIAIKSGCFVYSGRRR